MRSAYASGVQPRSPTRCASFGPLTTGGAPLPDLVRAAARRSPGEPALVDASTGRVVTRAALAASIDQAAGSLAARGFRPGDVLALWAPNGPAWAEAALGALAAGGTVTGIGPQATPRELAGQLADSGASVLATVPPPAEAATGAHHVVMLSDLRGDAASSPRPPLHPDAPALLPYSSGTTGLPKGVVITHANLAAAVAQAGRGLGLGPADTLLGVAPMAHVMGFVVSLAAPLAAGATVVTLPRLGLGELLGALERHRVTVLVAPPPVMAALAHHPAVAEHDLGALEVAVSGGAPLSPDLRDAVAARLPGVRVAQGYGLTETIATVAVPDRERGNPRGSAGRIAPGTEVRVVDPATGSDVAPGQEGELWVRGPQVTPGYRNRPEATAQLLAPGGWLRTGDLGRVEGGGDVVVVDRLKELIKVDAYQVAPAELEALLAAHPAVADAAVVGRPDGRRGEVPFAFVVARGPLDEDELIAWVAPHVAPYKRLHAVRLVDDLPRTPPRARSCVACSPSASARPRRRP